MDDHRFDRLAVQLGRVMTRRHVGSLLAALGLGAGPGPALETAAKKKRKKKKKPTECRPDCSEANPCGAPDGCGGACKTGSCPGAQVCVDGACQDDCPSPKTLCPNGCVNTSNDNLHCGGCGAICPNHSTCTGGECVCHDGFKPCRDECIDNADCCTNNLRGCAQGETCCVEGGQGVCRNLNTDESNCGGCGNDFACASGEQCIDGACQDDCASPKIVCGGNCVDPRTDSSNCNGCGAVCQGDLTCIHSACQCASGSKCGTACVDLQSDPENCGTCNLNCGTGACQDGQCVCVDPSHQICYQRCVDPYTDRCNCGACGWSCYCGSESAAAVCDDGECCYPTGYPCGYTGFSVDCCSRSCQWAGDAYRCAAACASTADCSGRPCVDGKCCLEAGVSCSDAGVTNRCCSGVCNAGPGTSLGTCA